MVISDLIKLNIDYEEYETHAPFKAMAWSMAVLEHGFEGSLASEISELCFILYIDLDGVDGVSLVNYICEKYNDLNDDYKDIRNGVRQNLLGAWF